MNKLITALQRLYFFPDQQACTRASDAEDWRDDLLSAEIVAQSLAGETSVAFPLLSADGMTRTMLIGFDRAGDWPQVAALYQAILEDLDLPAPAVSVSGFKGYQMWFSLAEAIPVAQARDFLDLLRRKYLADVPAGHLRLLPNTDSPATAERVMLAPALNTLNGKWSAFIDPSMGSMFVEGPWLEMAPNLDRQADMLAALKSIAAADFSRALQMLQTPLEPDDLLPVEPLNPADEGASTAQLNVGNDYRDPTSFLLAVMNDASASTSQRIKAAKALLPYFPRSTS
jgi:hypothetical protein